MTTTMSIQNYAIYIGAIIKKVFYDFFWQKVIVALFTDALLFSFDPKLYGSLRALIALVIIDFLIGIYASKKTGKQITSSKAVHSAIKLAVYSMLISAGLYTEKAVGYNLFIDETIIGFLAISNLISILEHASALGYPTPKNLLNYLKDLKNKR